MPAFEVEAMEERFAMIHSQNMKAGDVTAALRDLHGEHNFLYPTVELQQLYKNFKGRYKYDDV